MVEKESTKVECELNAWIGDDGYIIIEVNSEECKKAVITAISEKGVSIKHVKPRQTVPQSELG